MGHKTPFITVNDLSYACGDRLILDRLSFQIPRGKITAIMGPSGTGKTTLLRLIGGMLTPARGSIEIDGELVHQLSRKELYTLRQKMGMLFQQGGLFTHLSVFDNVAFPLRAHTKLPERMIHDIVLMKLNAVGLRGARACMPNTLSGGMTRRVALARAIARDPLLMMYDEPFTGQDPISMGVLVKLIQGLNTALGITSVIVSHDITETFSIADYVYLIAGGRIVGQGEPKALQENTNPHVQQFMQGLPDGAVPFHYPAVDFQTELLGDLC